MVKKVFITVIYRCDQGIEDSLDIADVVLMQMHTDLPNVRRLYGKSDNASAYMGNYVMEALYKLCQQHQKVLIRYDFNEPCKGKDQCDREAAYLKCLVRGYVDAGNDTQSAEDIAKVLKHGNSLLNTKVAVAAVSNKSPRLSYPAHSEVAGIKCFHSFKFFKTHMVAWKFYNVGSGVKLPYVGVEFKPSIKLVEEFQPCHHPNNITPLKKPGRTRPERAINLLYFCPELNCAKIFDTQQELDAHCLSNEHDSVEAKSSLDKVKPGEYILHILLKKFPAKK